MKVLRQAMDLLAPELKQSSQQGQEKMASGVWKKVSEIQGVQEKSVMS